MKIAMRMLVVCLATSWSSGFAATPQQTWTRELAEANIAWAKAHFAILKIQDAAYLRNGDVATLVGVKGKPETYRWTKGVAPSGVLTATVKDGRPSVKMGVRTYSEAEIAKGIPVADAIDILGTPTQVSAGVIGARIMVYNQNAKAAKDFKGVDFFPYDPAYRVTAAFKADPQRPARVFRTSRGTDKEFFHAGDATFVLAGKTVTLPFYADDRTKIEEMSAFFIDDLTGKQTYGAGRYVDVADYGAFPPKAVTIDFNEAYNPNCARSPFYTCPVAIDVIPAAVKAGERDPHTAH
jgi:hypothetical protein